MARAVLVTVMIGVSACAAQEPAVCQPGVSASVAGAWALTMTGGGAGPGGCAGSLAIEEATPGIPCWKAVTATWSCGALTGTECEPYVCPTKVSESGVCDESFRYENYLELYLCSTSGQRFVYTGTVSDSMTGWGAGGASFTAEREPAATASATPTAGSCLETPGCGS